jgi:lipoprotein signal peptidase
MKTIGLLILLYFFLKKKKFWFSRVAALFIFFLILDLVTKTLAQWAVLSQVEWWSWPVSINAGVSFGIGEKFFETGSIVAILLGWIILASGISFFLLKYLRTTMTRSGYSVRSVTQLSPDTSRTVFLSEVATGMLLGGIWGNVLDRIFVGGVRDWLPVPGYELFFGLTLYNNLADWFLTVGCILWIYLLFFKIKTS